MDPLESYFTAKTILSSRHCDARGFRVALDTLRRAAANTESPMLKARCPEPHSGAGPRPDWRESHTRPTKIHNTSATPRANGPRARPTMRGVMTI